MALAGEVTRHGQAHMVSYYCKTKGLEKVMKQTTEVSGN
jgi:hypothetical protein